jgi:Phosphotransferase enzyme family
MHVMSEADEPIVARSRAELLAGAESRVVVDRSDGKSGSEFEQVTIGGERCFAKTLGYRTDWIMRVTGDRDLRTLKIWRAGIMRDVPPEIDHAVVAMACDGEGEDALLTILMRDIGEHLFAEGDSEISLDAHLGLLDGLAALSAHYWGWTDDIGLTSLEARLRFFAPDNIAPEVAVDDPPVPIRVAAQGWPQLAARAPGLAELLAAIHASPGALADAMRSTPATFLHGDWKMGNLGRHPDGRTILLDWAYPGSGPVLWDLAWYLALNAARLPMEKEATIDAFRDALERRGVATADWFDLQLDLCLLGMTACFGWEKAVGAEDELRWWERRALLGARRVADSYPVPST